MQQRREGNGKEEEIKLKFVNVKWLQKEETHHNILA